MSQAYEVDDSFNTLGVYRLSREGITVSMVGEDGVIKTYRQGDEVRITGRKAKEIGAVKVGGNETENKEVIKTFRQVIEPSKMAEGLKEEVKEEAKSSLDLSTISHLSFDKAINLISKITLLSDLKLAEEIESKGKRRRSVLEAINGRRNQIGNPAGNVK